MAALFESFQATSTVKYKWKRSQFVCLAVVITVVLYIGFQLLSPQREDFKVLNILCFGDSLTAGMINRTTSHPYSLKLQQHFDRLSRTEKHGKLTTKIHNVGLPGEVVQKSMEDRLPMVLKRARRKFDWVIILGGTNDIRRILWEDYFAPVNSKAIFEALRGLHLTSHKYGAKSAVLTIPARQCEVKPECSEVKEVRKQINRWLREFARTAGRDKVVLVDLAREMDYSRLRHYWSDELHFTADGYDKIADVIFEVLKQHL